MTVVDSSCQPVSYCQLLSASCQLLSAAVNHCAPAVNRIPVVCCEVKRYGIGFRGRRRRFASAHPRLRHTRYDTRAMIRPRRPESRDMGAQSAAILWSWAVSMPARLLSSRHDICRPGGRSPVRQKLSAWGESTPTPSCMHRTVFPACLRALAGCSGTGPMLRSRRTSLFATSELRRSRAGLAPAQPTASATTTDSRWTRRCSSTWRRVQAASTRG